MYRISIAVIVIASVFSTMGCSRRGQDANEWFTTPGHVLEYEAVKGTVIRSKSIVTYTIGKFNGVRCIKATRTDNMMPVALNMYYSMDGGEVNWLGIDADEQEGLECPREKNVYSMAFKPFVPLFTAQPKVGDCRKGSIVTFVVGENAVEVSAVEARVECMESVSVPAGTYECLKVVLEMREARGSRSVETMTFWFAKGIGIVKSIMFVGEEQEILMLTSYR